MLPVYLVLAVLLAPAAAPAQEQEAVSLAREAVPQASGPDQVTRSVVTSVPKDPVTKFWSIW